jgi:hypothetical protein
LVEKAKEKILLGRPRRRREDNIKMDPKAISEVVDWIRLAQDRDTWRALVTTVMNLQLT